MRRAILTAAAVLLCALAFGQESRINEILSSLRDSRVSFSYSCTVMEQNVPIKLDGRIKAQGDCYYACGNGLEFYCDGKTRWTVDPEAKEVYIEKAGGLAELLGMQDELKDLKVSDLKREGMSDNLEAFKFNTTLLDRSWVVTDLRTE